MKTNWSFIESQITNHTGHYYNYLRSLLQHTEARAVYVPTSCKIANNLFIKALTPWKPKHYGRYGFWAKPASAFYQLRMSIRRFAEISELLKALDKEENHVVVWTTVDDFELVSFLLLNVPENITLFGIVHMKVQSLYAKLAMKSLQLLNLIRHSRKALGCNSSAIQSQIKDLGGDHLECAIVPYPFQKPSSINPAEPGKRFISYLGDARTEKGLSLLLACIPDLTVRAELFIQCNLPNNTKAKAEQEMIKKLEAVKQQRNKRIFWQEEVLSDEEYQKAFISSKILVLPYLSERYEGRVSGILGEALINGVPVVVSPGTWLAEQVEMFGGGVVMKEYTNQGLLQAVDTILADLENYSGAAAKAGEAFYEINNAKSLKKVIEKSYETHS